MRFGSVFLENNLGFFSRVHFFFFGLPNLGTAIRKNSIERALPKIVFPPKRILDLGCGAGEFSFFLAEKFPAAKVKCIDKKLETKKLFSFAKRKGIENISFSETDFFGFGEKNFDLVFSVEVFEHFPDLKKAVSKVSSIVSKKGFLLLHVPSADWANFRHFDKKNFPRYLSFLQKEHHSNKITMENICHILELHGFILKYSKKTFGPLARFCWELDLLLMEKRMFLARSVILPFLKSISFFDAFSENSNGTGILVLAQKE